MKTYWTFGLMVLLLMGCKSTLVSEQQAEQNRQQIAAQRYEVVLEWASPSSTRELNALSNANLLGIDNRSGRIDLSGSENYIRVFGDSVSVYLPYQGTRYAGVTPNNTNGTIKFEGVPINYALDYNEAKQRSTVSFGMRDRGERLDVAITIQANNSADVYVSSSQRNSIKYDGYISDLQ
ncbi:MAG: DUF4251 domain-containing protein [Bacteroidota bacterium]